MSDKKKKRAQDNGFRPWSIIGLEQCGDDGFRKKQESEEDEFQVLYEQEKTEGEDDAFKRLYELDADPDDPENAFKPFHGAGSAFEVNSDEMKDDSGIPISKDGEKSGTDEQGGEEKGDLAVSGDAGTADSGNFGASAVSANGDADSDSQGGESQEIAVAEKERSSSLAAEKEMAFEEGFSSGFEQGKTQGYDEGLILGREQGYKEGLEKGEQEGYDTGLEKGEETGKMLAESNAGDLIRSLEDICLKTEQAWQTMVKKQENQILALVCKIAEKVAYAKVELSEGVVKEAILQALAVMPEPEEIILNISPKDYEYIEMAKDDFFEKFKSLKSVSVISNPSIQRGGCKIESSKAKVETDIASRLEAVTASIMAARVA